MDCSDDMMLFVLNYYTYWRHIFVDKVLVCLAHLWVCTCAKKLHGICKIEKSRLEYYKNTLDLVKITAVPTE